MPGRSESRGRGSASRRDPKMGDFKNFGRGSGEGPCRHGQAALSDAWGGVRRVVSDLLGESLGLTGLSSPPANPLGMKRWRLTFFAVQLPKRPFPESSCSDDETARWPPGRNQLITHNRKEGHMNVTAVVCALSLLIGGMALVPASGQAAGWISGADSYVAPWVKDIEQELLKKEYRSVYASDPRAPQAVVLRLLNQAAKAQAGSDTKLAEALVREALSVFEEGVRRHYYSESDIEPITKFIRQHVPIKAA